MSLQFFLMPQWLIASLSFMSYTLILFILGLLAWCVITERFHSRDRAKTRRIRQEAVRDIGHQMLTDAPYIDDDPDLRIAVGVIGESLSKQSAFYIAEVEDKVRDKKASETKMNTTEETQG